MLDIAVAYNRYKYLGHEFLTWLWYRIETGQDTLREIEPEMVSLSIGNRIVLENNRDNHDEVITIRGDGAGLEEGLIALKKGGKVTDIHLIFRSQELEWRFNLKGESLCVSSLKCPQTGKVEKKEDIEGAVLERIFLLEQILELVRKLYARFIRDRVSPEWDKEIVREINKWIDRSMAE